MSEWRRLSLKKRAIYLTVMVFVLTATAWASGQWVSDWDEATATGVSPVPIESTPADLEAPLTERPSEIFVQKTSAFGDRGNVLVSLQLTPDQVAAKQADGTADFITIGDLSHQVILRDDGDGGDGRAGDGLFTGLATVDVNDLAARASADSAAIASRSGSTTVPVFQDRAVVGTATPQAFDYAGFNAGAAVRLEPAVAFV
ncbi:MAG TPA: choice-of-anchor X domain-containing protein, partial [Thermoanaerobaculia bacterium]|nr:choice-of-anchor X domain-containing protein [Thermoanaerobaculia bacterium]